MVICLTVDGAHLMRTELSTSGAFFPSIDCTLHCTFGQFIHNTPYSQTNTRPPVPFPIHFQKTTDAP